MNTITRQILICSVIAALGLLGGAAWAQNAPATPPQATAPAPAAPAAPAQPDAAPPAAADDAAADADTRDDDGPRSANDTSDADPPIVWTRDRARGWRGGARFYDDNGLVTIAGDSTLSAGSRSDAVVSVFGSSTSSGDVRDAVVSVFGNTRIEDGRVGDAAVAVFGNNYVNAEIDGDVVAVMGDVELGPNARVRGNAVVIGGQFIRDPNAVISGNIQHIMTIPKDALVGFKSWVKSCLRYLRPLAFERDLGWAWTIALSVLALYALFAVVFRKPLDQCVQTLEERPGETIVASVLALLLSPVVYMVLGITVIGIPFIPIVSFAMLLATLFGKAVVLAWIGRGVLKVANQNDGAHTAIAVLLGGAIILLLYVVPVLGFLVFNLLGILGFGVVVYTLMLSSRAKRKSTPPPTSGARAPGGGPTPAPAGAGSANMSGAPAGAAPYTAGFSAEAMAARAGGASAAEAGSAAADAAAGRDAAEADAAGAAGASGSLAADAAVDTAAGRAAAMAASSDDASGMGAGASAEAPSAAGGAESADATSAPGDTTQSERFASAGPSDGGVGGGFDGGISGGPPPSNGTADALSLPRAGFWIRMLALLIDTVIVGVVFSVLDHSTKLQLIALAAYGAIMWKLKGTTVGGIVCNLKIVRVDGREIDWSTAIVRALGCFLSLVVCGLGFIWIAFDPGRQAWHDKIAGTAVVRVPQGVSLL